MCHLEYAGGQTCFEGTNWPKIGSDWALSQAQGGCGQARGRKPASSPLTRVVHCLLVLLRCCRKLSPLRFARLSSNWDPRPVTRTQKGNWQCPECHLLVPVGSKFHHFRTGHTQCDIELIKTQQPTVVAATRDLPQEQTGWTCPIPGCGLQLPVLGSQDHNRAAKAHCQKFHPKETPRTLAYKIRKRKPKCTKATSQKQLANHEEYPLQQLSTWWVRLINCEPGHAKAVAEAVERSMSQMDKDCLSLIQSGRWDSSVRRCFGRPRGHFYLEVSVAAFLTRVSQLHKTRKRVRLTPKELALRKKRAEGHKAKA